MRDWAIATLILLNGPPGVGKSTIARRLRDDRPLSLLVDVDELWPLISEWEHHEASQSLAFAAGLGMARAHLEAGYDVVAPQYAVGGDFFAAVDALVAVTAVSCHEIVLTGDPARVAARFRQRRAERASAGDRDVSANIADDRVDEVIARATEELTAIVATRPRAVVVSTAGGVEATYRRVCETLRGRT